jgi:2-dehydropantoate 2-reductase
VHKKAKINIGIFGLGAIGSVMATYLNDIPNLELFYFNRSSKSQISIDGPLGKTDIIFSLNPTTFSLDWLLICLKEYHYESALKDIFELVSPATKLVLIRNGLHLEKSLKGRVSNERILPCMINCPTEKIGKLIKYCNHPILSFPKNKLAASFKDIFVAGPMQIDLADDFLSTSWMKLIESACLGSIMTLNNDTTKVFRKPEIKIQYQNLLAECICVAKADNAHIPNDYIQQIMDKLKSYPDDKGSSMLTDFRNGNQLELNAKNGIIIELSKLYEISTPLNQQIYEKLQAINESLNHS